MGQVGKHLYLMAFVKTHKDIHQQNTIIDGLGSHNLVQLMAAIMYSKHTNVEPNLNLYQNFINLVQMENNGEIVSVLLIEQEF